jgi:hypothetical protein
MQGVYEFRGIKWLRALWVRGCRGFRMSARSGISGSLRVMEFMISGGLDVGVFGCSGLGSFGGFDLRDLRVRGAQRMIFITRCANKGQFGRRRVRRGFSVGERGVVGGILVGFNQNSLFWVGMLIWPDERVAI